MEFLPQPIQDYADRYTATGPEYLAELDRETWLKVLYPRMLSGHLQGRVLSFFSRMVRPRRILEVGTYTGYSALCMAEGLQPGGTLTTLEVDPELETMIRTYFEKAGMADRMDLRIGSGLDIIPQLEGPFDLVFLDADKENYVNYFDLVLPKMPSGALLLADNVLWSGRVLDPDEHDKETEGLRRFAERVAAEPSVEQLLLPVRDGIMMVMKK